MPIIFRMLYKFNLYSVTLIHGVIFLPNKLFEVLPYKVSIPELRCIADMFFLAI